ncbi:hypothetical protein ACFV4F_12595 [Kitasatospora sp. NPDC059722]|uniref:hypothetical protein n=1 Tax=Kitasatospora sp. NPDC059722 TaxID=3346925 RepID=UPI0036CD5DF6
MTMNNRRTETAKRWTKLAAVPVGVLAAGAMVLGATHATVKAGAWNKDNTIESGSWTKSKVGSDQGTDAVVKVSNLMPGKPGSAKVTYTYEPKKSEGKESWGQVVLKDITVTKSGEPIIIPSQTELAKNLYLKITIKQGNHTTEEQKTLAAWYEMTNTDKNKMGRMELRREKLDRNNVHAPENKADVTLEWKLADNAPAEAENSGLKFDLGAEIDAV